ncbi:MAG: response regulator [Alphaproteobacteria bacterium]|nr:response regulator [Alphaproteobacteria bacterium]
MWRSRLIVVDDDDDVANVVCHVAERLDFDVQTASGLGAFDACALFEPDVIVLDIFMPEIDGFEVLRYLGQDHKHTSVIIASGKGGAFRDMAARMCEQHGLFILANLAKPFTIAGLQAALLEAKKRHPMHAKLRSSSHVNILQDSA